MKWTANRIEIALAKHFDYRQNVIVPNVSWGMGLNHECDLLMLRPSGYAEEFEIKVSASDLKRDQEKRHNHQSLLIKKLWFAVPEKLRDKAVEYVPMNAGIIIVKEKRFGGGWIDKVCVEKPAPTNKSRKLTDKERLNLLRLGQMRVWTLKESIYRNKQW